jgi:alcohol sulfotransferase
MAERDRTVAAVVSYPKSGRTWLSFLYAYYVARWRLGEEADGFLRELPFNLRPTESARFEGYLALHPEIPQVGFHHVLQPVTPYYSLDVRLGKLRRLTGASSLVALVRDPRDVVVSFYHHVRTRGIRGTRGDAGKHKALPEDVTISEFVRSETMGVRSVVAYLNLLAKGMKEQHGFARTAVVHYEDLTAHPEATFAQIVKAIGLEPDGDSIRFAVELASFTRLQGLEQQRRPARERDGLRFRRGSAGSHRAELTAADLSYLDRVIDAHLTPELSRYHSEAKTVTEPA